MIIFKDTEKAFDKTHHSFLIKVKTKTLNIKKKHFLSMFQKTTVHLVVK